MRVFLPALLLLHLAALAATVPSYVFTDATATIPSTATGPVAYQVKTIIPGGWGPEAAGTGAVKDGAIALKPLTEGIHVVTVAGAETRFLAMAPPERLDRKALRTALPHTGAKLLAGQPYTVLFLGDSVTSTGDYKTLLKMMLTRALGKADIRLVDRSRYGMTTDYSVRRYAQDITPVHPDLTLIMYGLNDQRSWDLGAYVEQIRYLAEHITRDGGDVLLLTPTPHFVSENDFKGGRPYGDALRTVQYADAVQRLARELKLPAADTFNPMWHGTTLEGAFRASWGLYPPDFGHQLTSVVETNGTGDPVHPNALGQLQIARAAYRALAGIEPAAPMLVAGGRIGFNSINLSVRNLSKTPRQGRLLLWPIPDATINTDYSLPPDGFCEYTLHYDDTRTPPPFYRYINPQAAEPCYAAVDVCGTKTHVFAVWAHQVTMIPVLTPARARFVTTDALITALPSDKGKMVKLRKPFTLTGAVGRQELDEATLAYTRFGAAAPGEAVVDGKLDDWAGANWLPLGEKCQARTVRGPEDHRSTGECDVQWAAKAGAAGVFLAFRATGAVQKDSFIFYADPRAPGELGTAGPYFWVGGTLGKPDLDLHAGDTSPDNAGVLGAVQTTDTGLTAEAFIPYRLLGCTAWPAAGDLGAEVWWNHSGPGGQTSLYWACDGLPWNPRWYGVLRQSATADNMPWRIRVK